MGEPRVIEISDEELTSNKIKIARVESSSCLFLYEIKGCVVMGFLGEGGLGFFVLSFCLLFFFRVLILMKINLHHTKQ